jgi:hypothetical protein
MAGKISKPWLIGFLCGALLFVVINYFEYMPLPRCEDCSVRYGWPFVFSRTGGMNAPPEFHRGNLLLDIFIGVAFSIGLGTAFQWLAQRISRRKLKGNE